MGRPRFLELAARNLLTPPTLAALTARLPEPGSASPRALAPEAFATLVAVCERLRPPYERPTALEIALGIDAQIAEGGDGWRYDVLPPDADAMARGLLALEARAGRPFADLADDEADVAIRAAQQGDTAERRFMEDLLAGLATFVYSRPWAQDAMGYVGYADARGWRRIGPNEREDWEL